MANRIGQQLGNYRLMRLIGQGGFGEVYLGEHVYLKTQAAIKVLQVHLANEDIESFLKEARTIAGLKHLHIVRVLDFGIDGGTPFLVMDYAPHGTLRQRYPKGTQQPLTSVVPYVKQVADALQYAHDKKLVHRDIKPENMLIGENNEVLLSDFGIALVTQSSHYQSTQEVVGTVAYMAPEQLQGKPRPASDQYALGIIIYEWLCGERPFRGTFVELYSQHMFVPPAPLHEKVPDITLDTEKVVLTALAKDPRQRFISVKAFATALEQACERVQFSALAPLSQHRWPTIPVSSAKQPLQQGVIGTEHVLTKRGISRRTVLTSLTGLAVVGIASGTIWLALSQRSQISPVSFSSSSHTPATSPISSPTPKPTPHSLPPGTILLTYRGHSSWIPSVAWSPNGTRIASGSGDTTVQIFDTTTGDNVLTYRGHSNNVNGVPWSPSGRRIASGSTDGTVQMWDTSTGTNVFTYRGHTDAVRAVVWSPNGTLIASGSHDTTVQVWDASNGRTIFTYRGHTARVTSLAWSPDGTRIVSGSDDNTVQVWNASAGSNVLTYHGHSDTIESVTWSPNNTLIASGSHDRTVKVWSSTTGNNIFIYRGHSDWVNAVAWSPDGKHIVSGSNDQTVQVYNASAGSNVLTYRGHSNGINAVGWSPDNAHIASGSGDMTVQVWQAP